MANLVHQRVDTSVDPRREDHRVVHLDAPPRRDAVDVEAEDIAVMHGFMTDGMIYQIDASWSRKANDPFWGDVTMRVVGSKASASFDLYNNHAVHLYQKDGIEMRYPNYLSHQHAMIFLDYQRGRVSDTPRMNANEIDGLRTLELVFSAYQSIKTRESVSVHQTEI